MYFRMPMLWRQHRPTLSETRVCFQVSFGGSEWNSSLISMSNWYKQVWYCIISEGWGCNFPLMRSYNRMLMCLIWATEAGNWWSSILIFLYSTRSYDSHLVHPSQCPALNVRINVLECALSLSLGDRFFFFFPLLKIWHLMWKWRANGSTWIKKKYNNLCSST